MVTQNNATSYGSEWGIISTYLKHGLIKDSDKKGYRICPNCQQPKLSIAANGIDFNCYGCQDGKAILRLLEQTAYELGLKPSAKTKKVKLVDPIHTNNQNAASNNKDKDDEKDKYIKISHSGKVLDYLLEKYDTSEIRLNVRSKYTELQGMPIHMQTIRAQFASLHKVDIPRDTLKECLVYLGKRNQYDPVKEYLVRCHIHNAIINHSFLDGLALEIFGCDKPLSQKYLRKFLLGCVARVFEPGCKFDLSLIVQGKRGLGKTSFFDIIGAGFYSSSMSKKLTKDDNLNALKHWILEWGELEGFTKSEYNHVIKKFLSDREDSFRVPYGDTVETFPRNFVIVGTCNIKNFLIDPHGSRQFMVIPMTKRLDRDWLLENRDKIWAAALGLYHLKMESLKFTHEEEIEQATDNRQYEVGDHWLEVLEEYLDNQAEIVGMHVTTAKLFDILEKNGCKITRGKYDEQLLTDTLTKKNWSKTRKSVMGKQLRCWTYNEN